MWWLQLLFFSLGVLVPVVLARWLEERFYEHHDLPGKSSFQRLKFAIEVLAGNETMPETGFMTLKDRPRQFEFEGGRCTVVLVSWLCVFIGLYFFRRHRGCHGPLGLANTRVLPLHWGCRGVFGEPC